MTDDITTPQPDEQPVQPESPVEVPAEQPVEAPVSSTTEGATIPNDSPTEIPAQTFETPDEPSTETQPPKPVARIAEQAEARGRIYSGVLDVIGHTPLVRLQKVREKYHVQADLLVKLESFNPTSSDKDRIAYGMIEAAERAGEITPGETTLIEPTSGNTAISLAMVAAAKGYRLILVMPESMPIERRKFLNFMGAEVETTPAENGMKGAMEKAQEMLKKSDKAFIIGQFENPANPQIHAETTAEEIWADTQGGVDLFVAGVGTGGLITGVSKALKLKKAELQTFAVEPANSAILSGKEAGAHKIQGIGAGFVPAILDAGAIDSVVQVTDEQAFEMAKDVTQLEGLPCDIASGAVIVAAIEVGKLQGHEQKSVVAVLPSHAERYPDTELFM